VLYSVFYRPKCRDSSPRPKYIWSSTEPLALKIAQSHVNLRDLISMICQLEHVPFDYGYHFGQSAASLEGMLK